MSSDPLLLGQAAFDKKDWAAALHFWTLARQARPGDAQLAHALALAQWRLGAFEPAVALVEEALRGGKPKRQYCLTLISIHLARGAMGAAKASLAAMWAAFADDWQLRVAAAELFAGEVGVSQTRSLLFAAHRLAAALPDDQAPAARGQVKDKLQKIVQALVQQQRLGEAEHLVDLGVQMFPEAGEFVSYRIAILTDMGDLAGAAAHALSYCRAHEDDLDFAQLTAGILARAGRAREAVALAQRVWRADPERGRVSRTQPRDADIQNAMDRWTTGRRAVAREIGAGAALAAAVVVGVVAFAGHAGAALVLAGAVVVTPVVAELGYRLALWRARHVPGEALILPPYAPRQVEGFQLANLAVCSYEAETGFCYTPNVNLAVGRCEQGRVVLAGNVALDARGNISAPSPGYAEAPHRVAAFGDSFTANVMSQSGLHWPHFFAAAADARLGRAVGHVNFGREFFGLLQMIGLAARVVQAWKPTLVIIAYITRDLPRPRSWVHRVTVGGRERYLRTFNPDAAPHLPACYDAAVIDARADGAWFAARRQGGDGDAVLADAIARYAQYRARGDDRCVGLFDFGTSLVFNRLVAGDAFERDFTRGQRGREKIADARAFASDAALLRDVAALKAAGVKVALVHMPVREEIVQGVEYAATQVDMDIKAALEDLLGTKTVGLLPYIRAAGFDPQTFCISADDDHPSALGEKIYGEAIMAALADKGMLA